MEKLIVNLSYKEHTRLFKNILIDPQTNCHNWIGAKDSSGYGQAFYRNKRHKAHRLFFAYFVKPIPIGKYRKFFQLHHTCENKICCNPSHLKLISSRQNILLGNGPSAINNRKTHCIYGHPLTFQKNQKRRICKTCDSIRKKERMQGADREYWLKKAREAAKRWRDKHK